LLRGLTGEGLLRDRLAGVASYMAPRVLGRFDDEPILKEQMLDIYNRLSYVEAGPGDDGKINATVKRLTAAPPSLEGPVGAAAPLLGSAVPLRRPDQEARSIADDIVSLVFSELRRIDGE
jgi:hypothetical protein